MVTLHPASRATVNGFIPMVSVRGSKGQMTGSKVSQNGNVFHTAAAAKAFALITALRVAMRFPDMMTVAKDA